MFTPPIAAFVVGYMFMSLYFGGLGLLLAVWLVKRAIFD